MSLAGSVTYGSYSDPWVTAVYIQVIGPDGKTYFSGNAGNFTNGYDFTQGFTIPANAPSGTFIAMSYGNQVAGYSTYFAVAASGGGGGYY